MSKRRGARDTFSKSGGDKNDSNENETPVSEEVIKGTEGNIDAIAQESSDVKDAGDTKTGKGVTGIISRKLHGKPALHEQIVERFSFTAPISKKKIEGTKMSLDLSTCVKSKYNPRIESLMSMNDEDLLKLKNQLLSETQQTPGKVVVVNTPEGRKYEILDGFSRAFCLNYINNNDLQDGEEKLQYVAWVFLDGDLTEEDKMAIARVEEDTARKLSFYERAADYRSRSDGLLRDRPGTAPEVIASILNVSRSYHFQLMSCPSLPDWLLGKVKQTKSLTKESVKAADGLIAGMTDEQINEAKEFDPVDELKVLVATMKQNFSKGTVEPDFKGDGFSVFYSSSKKKFSVTLPDLDDIRREKLRKFIETDL